MRAGILDGFQTIIPTAAAVLLKKRQMLRCSFGLACRVIEALDMDVSKFYHGDYYLEEEVKTMRGKGIASRKKSSI